MVACSPNYTAARPTGRFSIPPSALFADLEMRRSTARSCRRKDYILRVRSLPSLKPAAAPRNYWIRTRNTSIRQERNVAETLLNNGVSQAPTQQLFAADKLASLKTNTTDKDSRPQKSSSIAGRNGNIVFGRRPVPEPEDTRSAS